MKKMLLATASLLITGCSTDAYCSKQTGSSSTKGNHHPSFFCFWNGQKKTVDAAKICGGAENVVKTETQQTFVNGLSLALLLGHLYSVGSACVLPTHLHELPIDKIIQSLLVMAIFRECLHSDQPLSEGEIIPFSGVCQSRYIIHAGGGGGFTH